MLEGTERSCEEFLGVRWVERSWKKLFYIIISRWKQVVEGAGRIGRSGIEMELGKGWKELERVGRRWKE